MKKHTAKTRKNIYITWNRCHDESRPEKSDIKKKLKYIGWNEGTMMAMYQDEKGEIWVDTNSLVWYGNPLDPRLCTTKNHERFGGPDKLMKDGIEVEFIPRRVTKDF